ncbi:hypothetical protein TNCV_3776321 [Trichonephila clavipes]|nr:hypothetical protein TNCV_3776321 [Trichonephila clavipes]
MRSRVKWTSCLRTGVVLPNEKRKDLSRGLPETEKHGKGSMKQESLGTYALVLKIARKHLLVLGVPEDPPKTDSIENQTPRELEEVRDKNSHFSNIKSTDLKFGKHVFSLLNTYSLRAGFAEIDSQES